MQYNVLYMVEFAVNFLKILTEFEQKMCYSVILKFRMPYNFQLTVYVFKGNLQFIDFFFEFNLMN